MGLPVRTVAAGGLPVVETTRGTPVTEAAVGVAVTKIIGKPGLPVTFESIGVVAPGPAFTVTWNAVDKAIVDLTNGDLTATTNGTGGSGVRASTGKSTGKFYFEATMTTWAGTGTEIGLGTSGAAFGGGGLAGHAVVTKSLGGVGGSIWVNAVDTGINLGARSNGNIIGTAVDLTAGLIWFRVSPSGSWNATSGTAKDPATGVGGVSLGAMAGSNLFPMFGAASIGQVATVNLGASAFSGAVPSGFTAGWPV